MLLGALASSPLPAKVEASSAVDGGRYGLAGPSLRLCFLESQISFVPNLRAYRGMLGRACCRSPTAALECVVGRHASACAFGHCVRNGRVSGDWLVWACWIPARAATTPLQAASIVGTSALPPLPRSVSCAAYLLRRHSCAAYLCQQPRRSTFGVHRSSRPFCRRCAPGLNWSGHASNAVTLKKLECSKQAYALYTLAWDNIIGFRSYYVGFRDRTFAKDVFINQERKLGARRRSDTVLVSTINDADQGSADVAFGTPPAPYEKSKSLGSGGTLPQTSRHVEGGRYSPPIFCLDFSLVWATSADEVPSIRCWVDVCESVSSEEPDESIDDCVLSPAFCAGAITFYWGLDDPG
ncbi:UNVERIFIED_CONTAM: hypothetical protein Scaly_2890300 [Sesamum calycinum]|uniref:Uncharacterized protein n=1 Tax=Sesamum calycinum TaxID=2727403 RepID=A0AAW2L9Y3_9LAMI